MGRCLSEVRGSIGRSFASNSGPPTVVCAKGLDLPFPRQTTLVTCTLNNGIHFVTTPECNLEKDCQIEQEFEL